MALIFSLAVLAAKRREQRGAAWSGVIPAAAFAPQT